MACHASWSIAVSLALLTLTGCQASPSGLDASSASSEYRTERDSLSWPPGEKIQEPTYSVKGPDGGSQRYGVGVGKADAQMAWLCKWVQYGRKHGVNRQVRANIASIEGKYFYKNSLNPEDRPAFDVFLKRMEYGDTNAMDQFVAGSCAP